MDEIKRRAAAPPAHKNQKKIFFPRKRGRPTKQLFMITAAPRPHTKITTKYIMHPINASDLYNLELPAQFQINLDAPTDPGTNQTLRQTLMQEERNKNVAGVNEHTKPFYLNKVLQKQLGKKAALIYDGIKIRDLDLLYLNYFKDVKTLVLIFKHNKNKYFIVKIKPQQRQTDRANAHTGETHVTFYTITNITGVYLDEYTEIEEINRLINPEAAAAPAAPAPESPLVYALPTQEINGINVSFIFSKKAAAAAAAATRHPNIPNDYSAAGGRTRRRRTRTRTRKNKRV